MREVDAIVHVVRCFEDSNIVHVDGSIDPLRDIETINLELIFSDMEVLERRLSKQKRASYKNKEIAKECNVSVATVSNILNHKPGASDETRRIVMAKIKELNYKPNTVARNLKTKNTRTIGVIVEDMTIFSIPDIVDGITEHCEENNYQILLINLRLFKKYNDFYYHRDDYYDRVEQEIDKLIARQVEGVIYVTAHERVMKCILEKLPVPAVMAYGYTQNKNIPSIVVNDEDGHIRLSNIWSTMATGR